MTVTVKKRQTWHDLAIYHTGNVANAFDLALANGVSVSSGPVPGTEVVIPDGLPQSPETMQYLRARGIEPATGYVPIPESGDDYVLPGELPMSL